jgi:phasin family protein
MKRKPTAPVRSRAATATPVTAAATPIAATAAPVAATAMPVSATAAPVAATATPVAATARPVATAAAPVAPAKAFAMPAAVPSSSTLTQGTKTMMNTNFDFVAFGKDNLEAITAASKIWSAGVQDLTKQMASTAKASMEETVETFKALSGVKSVKEAIELQTTYSKAVAAKAMAESTKLSEASIKLTEQALAPITARMAVAVGSFSKAA